jgi:hypothetical protein
MFRFNLTGNRRKIGVDDPRLEDRVADNLAKFEITESEWLLFGTDFGVGTDIRTGPNGNLFVVSLSNGTAYESSGVEAPYRDVRRGACASQATSSGPSIDPARMSNSLPAAFAAWRAQSAGNCELVL